ncbi:hypothetical protein R1V99_08340, partial [Stenotrophomonas maltophilia]|nr:hypothetical protein [Stenotrophomonas maltophilia]
MCSSLPTRARTGSTAPASKRVALIAATGAMPVAATSPATALMWIAVTLAAATAVAWVLRRPNAQATWPRTGFG